MNAGAAQRNKTCIQYLDVALVMHIKSEVRNKVDS